MTNENQSSSIETIYFYLPCAEGLVVAGDRIRMDRNGKLLPPVDKIICVESNASSRAIAFAGAVSGSGIGGEHPYDWHDIVGNVMEPFKNRYLSQESLNEIQDYFLQMADKLQKHGSYVLGFDAFVFEARPDKSSAVGKFCFGGNGESFGFKEFSLSEPANSPEPLPTITKNIYQQRQAADQGAIESALKFIHSELKHSYGDIKFNQAKECFEKILDSLEVGSPYGNIYIAGSQIELLEYPQALN
jgi:hypothetical protein